MQGIKTLHFFNIPNELEAESNVKFFHEQWIVPVFMIYYKNRMNIEQDLKRVIPLKHSDAEGYVMFAKGQRQFVSILQLVKKANPLARCLFIVSNIANGKVLHLHKLAWKRFGLVNVLIVLQQDGQQPYWSHFNPFEKRQYNLLTMSNAPEYLRNKYEFKNLQGYSIQVREMSANYVKQATNVSDHKFNRYWVSHSWHQYNANNATSDEFFIAMCIDESSKW